jgi:hypothetical protein
LQCSEICGCEGAKDNQSATLGTTNVAAQCKNVVQSKLLFAKIGLQLFNRQLLRLEHLANLATGVMENFGNHRRFHGSCLGAGVMTAGCP